MSDLLAKLQTALSGRYAVEKELGRGGMAIVFLARDVKHGRSVALKVLLPELAASVGAEAFLQEIQVTARLQHPLILPLHDSGAAEGFLYYVMPYVEGETLGGRLRRESQLPVADAVRIARDVAEALGYAHEKDVVHRDIKPDNILLTSGHAVVADFGIARAIEVAGGRTLRQSELVSGTPTYMSPEQATGGVVDGRSDVYSLGCVLYEMLAGAPPFVEVSVQRLLQRIITDPPSSVRTHRPAVSPVLDQVVARALEKLPADRFSGAAQMGEALLAVSVDTARVTTSVGLPPSGPVAALGIFRVLAVYVGIAVLVLALVFVLVQLLALPDWVVPAAGILLLAGIPILAATAHLQRRALSLGDQSAEAMAIPKAARWLSFRNAVLGGILAFAVFVLVVGGYMISRKTGIGPGASLVSAGVLDERDPILVADFQNRTEDPLLGTTVMEAMSVDLAQSSKVTLMPKSDVAEALGRMQRPPDTILDSDLARELAVREGIKAMVTGQVLPAGKGYVLSASLVASSDGRVLAGFREGAAGPEEVIPAIDRLSKRMREKIGESLRTIRAEKPLEQVTTQSLPALQKYSIALRAEEFEGNQDKAIALLEEAVVLDSTFAMAHRKLAIILGNTARDPARAHRAISQAFAHRARLSDRERYLTEGSYYMYTDEPEKAITSYQRLLDIDPQDTWALNNIGVISTDLGRHREAMAYYVRANEAEPSALVLGNIGTCNIYLGEYDQALKTAREFQELYPGNPFGLTVEFFALFSRGEFAAAESLSIRRLELDGVRESPFLRARVLGSLAAVTATKGRLKEADRYSQESAASFQLAGDMAGQLHVGSMPLELAVFVREDPAKAKAELETLESRFPLERFEAANRPFREFAMLYAITGNPTAARAMLDRETREVDPLVLKARAREIREVQAMIALAENRPQDAVQDFLALRAENPGDLLRGLAGLAYAYDLGGELDSARVNYERYLTTPDVFRFIDDRFHRARTLARLGEIYESRGERARALEYYSEFVELWKDADPELQDRVRAIRKKIDTLAGERGRS